MANVLIGNSDNEENSSDALDSYISSDDSQFPSRLKVHYPECKGIYVRGDSNSLHNGVAIIGSRKATPYGLRAAELIAQWATEIGFTVFSGCANGCDQAAQRSALIHGGRAVGVMGCGADVLYPSNAQQLLDDISETGALVSEYEWGTPPMKYRFRQRNRLLVALARIVVVAEARIPSGTFSAVNHALEVGTPVAAVPGSIFSFDSAGPNRIISDGAQVIASKQDFLVACSMASESLDTIYATAPAKTEDPLVAILRSDAYLPEEIAELLGVSLIKALQVLNNLEVLGVATRFPGGRYSVLK